jgi:hypothetical protein
MSDLAVIGKKGKEKDYQDLIKALSITPSKRKM